MSLTHRNALTIMNTLISVLLKLSRRLLVALMMRLTLIRNVSHKEFSLSSFIMRLSIEMFCEECKLVMPQVELVARELGLWICCDQWHLVLNLF